MKNISISILLLLIVLSCGEKSSERNNQSSASPQQAPVAASSSSQFLYINDQTNTQLAEIAIASDGSVVITTASGKYFGDPKGEKLKFYNSSDQFVAETKYSDSGFKVRDGNSTLKWKVKTYEQKIKIADNEEMDSPLEIKLKNAQKITVLKNGDETVIRVDPNDSNTLIGGKYYARGFNNNYHHAILADDRFSILDKCMILLEINKL